MNVSEGTKPLGIYISIPFCVARCSFCNFNTQGYRLRWTEPYLHALHQEIDLAWLHHDEYQTTSVYFGGGTASLYAADALANLIAHCFEKWPQDTANGVEVTMEIHPATVELSSLVAYRSAGVTRLSMGVQSFSDARLHQLGRHHTAAQTLSAYQDARIAGFDNVSFDLMYALPEQTAAEWEDTLTRAIDLAPEHISIYALSIERQTLFDRRQVTPLDEEATVKQYQYAQGRLTEAGFLQYEISNFARPGLACRHNNLYWDRRDTLGLGLSACSYVDETHWSNVEDLPGYLEKLSAGESPRLDMRKIGPDEVEKDRLIFGLRKSSGLPIASLNIEDRTTATRLMEGGLLTLDQGRIKLTAQGMLLADEVALAFL